MKGLEVHNFKPMSLDREHWSTQRVTYLRLSLSSWVVSDRFVDEGILDQVQGI